jgi:hypothetical protein
VAKLKLSHTPSVALNPALDTPCISALRLTMMAKSISYEWLALQSSLLFALHTLISNLDYACSFPNLDSMEEK